MLTVSSLMKRWGCGNKAVLDAIHKGRLRAVITGGYGKRYSIELADVERYEREHGRPRRARKASPEQLAIPRGVSQRHQAARPAGARASGLRTAIRDRAGFDPGELSFWPDGYDVDAGTSTITLYEVVITHALDAGKVRKLGALCDVAGSLGWRVRLLVAGGDAKYVEHDPRTGRPTEAAIAASVTAAFREFP